MSTDPPSHHWQVTVRSAGDGEPVEAILTADVLPLLRDAAAATHVTLAACVNCAGEYTYMADWQERDAVTAFEATEAYRDALERLVAHLRAAPKRELWRVIAS